MVQTLITVHIAVICLSLLGAIVNLDTASTTNHPTRSYALIAFATFVLTALVNTVIVAILFNNRH